jgi:hypothetical protein
MRCSTDPATARPLYPRIRREIRDGFRPLHPIAGAEGEEFLPALEVQVDRVEPRLTGRLERILRGSQATTEVSETADEILQTRSKVAIVTLILVQELSSPVR